MLYRPLAKQWPSFARRSMDLHHPRNPRVMGIEESRKLTRTTHLLQADVSVMRSHIFQALTIAVPVQHAPYPYPHPIETQWPPSNSFLPSSTLAESPSWRHSPSTVNSAYGSESNVSGGHTPAALSTSSTISYGHQDGHWAQQHTFQPPARSMSYGNIEGVPHQYPGQGLSIQHDYPRRTSPYPYPTTIDTSSSTVNTTTLGGSTSAPLSAPHSYYPPAWPSYDSLPSHGPPISSTGRSMSAQWYAEPGHLDRVQEEGTSPMAYNHSGLPQFYSGA
jgi:hypothetical protein